MAELFGFNITRVKPQTDPKQQFSQPAAEDGTQVVAAGGFFGSYLDMEGTAKTEQDLIRRYREIALHPECDMAIEDIVNEAITSNENKQSVKVITDGLEYSSAIKVRIEQEFADVLRLLQFNTRGHDLFRRWYVDGRIFFQKVIDAENIKNGIVELKYLDPRKVKKIREVRKRRPEGMISPTNINIADETVEYFVYNERGISGAASVQGIKIAVDTIAFCPSGMIDQNKNGLILSYLHKAIKPVNQLRMIEDAAVIYRIARAPERRIFKIDVGNLPKAKAESYLRDVMARYRNKLVYDASTGEIRDDRNYMSMLEDFWLPSREGGRGTDITTLPGGANLGEIADIEYFRAKLYRSLNVPVSRLEASQGFNLGRASEISRDELKFTKFVGRLRKKFTELFNDLLRTQLIIKGVISETEWPLIRDSIFYDFLQDGHFAELKNTEMMRERLGLAREVRDYVGKYFSVNYVRRNILKQTESEIKKMDAEIKKEIDDGIISSPEVQTTGNDDLL
jgi:hypothetical protein|tara:strand:+ start:486 stop:2012 length:1527 start_codon:yes stop_codon:yes gene_type:complete